MTPDQRRDGERERNPELVAEHRHAVPSVLLVRTMYRMTPVLAVSSGRRARGVLMMLGWMTVMRAGHGVAHRLVICGKLCVLGVARLDGLLTRSLMIVMVSM